MSFSSITRSQYRPIGRQPFRPGQWQGYKAASNHTTYIQNNFFGSGYNTGFNYDYNYGSCCHHDDGGMSKGMKWLLGIGLGSTLLGGILKLFGVGGGKETGSATSAQQQTNNDAVIGRNTPAPTQQTPEQVAEEILEETTQEEPPTQEEGAQEENSIKWNDLSNMVCRDASGKTQNISGKFNITQAGEEGQPPKEFTITDTSSGTPHTYTYELTGTTSDGKPLYTCKSMNGQTASQNEYTLETKEDGTPELVQHKGQKNFSKGLIFGSIANGGGTKPSFSQTVEVWTSVGKGTVTVTADSQDELKDKIEAIKNESAKWEPKQETPIVPWANLGTNPTANNQTNTAKTEQNVINQIKSSPKYKNSEVSLSKNSDGSYQVHIKTHSGEESRRIADLNKFDINEFTSRT